MDEREAYLATQWRKRLERRGWVSLRRGMPPTGRLVEYHIVWQRKLISGWGRLRDTDRVSDYRVAGSPAFLLERRYDFAEGVWWIAKNQMAVPGQIARPVPWHP